MNNYGSFCLNLELKKLLERRQDVFEKTPTSQEGKDLT